MIVRFVIAMSVDDRENYELGSKKRPWGLSCVHTNLFAALQKIKSLLHFSPEKDCSSSPSDRLDVSEKNPQTLLLSSDYFQTLIFSTKSCPSGAPLAILLEDKPTNKPPAQYQRSQLQLPVRLFHTQHERNSSVNTTYNPLLRGHQHPLKNPSK